jgi:hypothetical protein
MIVNATMAITSLIRVVQGREDYIYDPKGDGCLYARGGAPDCGVGHALHALGMSVDDLEWMDYVVDNTMIGRCPVPPGWYLTSVARKIFAGFQNLQDVDYTWGQALERAQQIAVNPNRFMADGSRL